MTRAARTRAGAGTATGRPAAEGSADTRAIAARTSRRAAQAPPHAAYAEIALVLQGGGALGSYQAGVFEGLADAGIVPTWVAGISIGALNAAVIAGNAPSRRVAQLRAFWEHICRQPWLPPWPVGLLGDHASALPAPVRRWLSQLEAGRSIAEGQNGFFVPRVVPPPTVPAAPDDAAAVAQAAAQASYYDTRPLRATLERFCDFDRINRPTEMRVSVGAVEVTTGNLDYFDNTRQRLGPEHFMASGALPPGFPAVEVGGRFYWDGGLVSNTPLFHVLLSEPRRDTLVFQLDLWSSRGRLPTTLADVAERQKDIQYSSRTRMVTDAMHEQQLMRRRLSELLALLPPGKRNAPAARRAAQLACDRRCNVLQLIYREKDYESDAKDYEFGLLTMRDHWASGQVDIRDTLAHPEWLAMPSADHPFVTHDVHRARRHASQARQTA